MRMASPRMRPIGRSCSGQRSNDRKHEVWTHRKVASALTLARLLSASLLMPFMRDYSWQCVSGIGQESEMALARNLEWMWPGPKWPRIGLLMGPNRYSDYRADFGPQYWTLYLLRVAVRLNLGNRLGSLESARGDRRGGPGDAALRRPPVATARVSRTGRVHGAFSAIERYSFSLILPLCLSALQII